ncbi:hypothetical protein Hanom_Chr07g00614791 [Helianthus anomalus]
MFFFSCHVECFVTICLFCIPFRTRHKGGHNPVTHWFTINTNTMIEIRKHITQNIKAPLQLYKRFYVDKYYFQGKSMYNTRFTTNPKNYKLANVLPLIINSAISIHNTV